MYGPESTVKHVMKHAVHPLRDWYPIFKVFRDEVQAGVGHRSHIAERFGTCTPLPNF